ncbi:MAG TPA: M28 family peptidase [Bacteroidetes bacterium]|nr:M28 family peptidase [Bacteroidota bacterium]
MKKILLFCSLFSAFHLFAQPSLTNVEVTLGTGNTMTITYDLAYPSNDLAKVTFRATERGGLIFGFDTSNATGDVGEGIASGMGRQIEWDYSAYAPIPDFRLMLVAELAPSVDIQALVEQVDSTRMSGDLTFLEGIRHRTAGAEHLQETKDFIELQFAEGGLEIAKQQFDFNGYQAENIIGRKIGTEEEGEVYIIDGHYDSVAGSPGADDNASGTAGMLEAMRILAPFGFKKTIRFIGFDLEEAGLVGSIEYVQNGIAQQENIAGVLNFEMIGYFTEVPNSQEVPLGFNLLFPAAQAKLEANQFRGDFVNVIGNGAASSLTDAYETAIENYVPQLNFISLEAPASWQTLTPDLGRSDHAPFWVAGVPALMLSDGANFRNPNYHGAGDTKDLVDFTFMHDVVQAAVATIAEVAGIQNAATWWTDTEFTTAVDEVAGCSFSISPNPAKDFLRLQWAGCQVGNFNIELLDINGRVIKNYLNRNGQNGQAQMVDVRGLEKGIYFIKVSDGEGQWARKVLVD